ncbi:SCO family protein [Zooshikella ganghwensis]|uniref:SCO family protein n=1 Tax=Zooshikella ganghwensis TaxID=202772 RepID=A0A4P9VHT4_9GAMM|nr:SCO family protein [Zooshikella ganghwensis]RDH42066.1 SCO family protein [Zooshikella ganghwensis]
MPKGIKLTVTGLIIFVALTLGLFVNRMMTPAPLDRDQLRLQGAYIFDTPRSFDNISLVSHKGNTVSKKTFKDKWTLIFFGYTFCPDICPTTLTELASLKKLLGEHYQQLASDVNFVFITVDPLRDTQEQLANYLPFFGDYFTGVTGSIKDIYNLASQLNVPFNPITHPKTENYLVDHSGNLLILNPKGDYHGFIKPPLEPAKIANILSTVSHDFELYKSES